MRQAVTKKIKCDPTACEEFFILVVEGHIISVAMSFFQLPSVTGDSNSPEFGKEHFLDASPLRRKELFMSSMKTLVSQNIYKYVMEKEEGDIDTVMVYGKEVLSLGMLYLEFTDGIREGDGSRILRCWRYLLLVFKATNKRKYAVQAATLLIQYHFIFTERMKQQLMWSRTINTSSRKGKNIPMDLHMEHLNRDLKGAIGHLSSNINKATIDRIAQSLYKVSIIKENFDNCTGVPQDSCYHSTPPLSKDLQRVVEEVTKKNVYTRLQGRRHLQFKTMKGNTVGILKKTDIDEWLKNLFRKLIRV